jgi:hypothetical protein
MRDKALQAAEQKTVLFYEDEITAVRMAYGEDYIPIRPICDNLGVSLTGQHRSIKRDPVLAEEATSCERNVHTG